MVRLQLVFQYNDFIGNKFQFNKREIEIKKLIKSDESSKAIADKLFLSFETIKSHRKNIHLKLGINHMADLVNFAVKYGL